METTMRKLLTFLIALAAIAVAHNADAATCFWVGGTGTWSTANAASWASSSGGTASTCAATGGIPKQSSDTATFDASSGGGTVTVDTTINGASLTGITMGAFTGTLDFSANNPSITLSGAFSITGSGVRTLNLGTGTFSLSGGSSTFDAGTATNLTASFAGATIAFTSASNVANRIFNGGGKTYGTVTFASPTTWNGSAQVTLSGANTIANLTLGAGIVATLSSSTNLTITNSFTWTGTASAPIVLIGAFNANGAAITSANNGTINFGVLAGITFSGGGTFTANNSFGYNSSGITINAPSGGGGGHIIGG
jgi:hypothetical protein